MKTVYDLGELGLTFAYVFGVCNLPAVHAVHPQGSILLMGFRRIADVNQG